MMKGGIWMPAKVSIVFWALGMIGLAYAMFSNKPDEKMIYKKNFAKEVQSIMKDFE
jgi:hypothetical protein